MYLLRNKITETRVYLLLETPWCNSSANPKTHSQCNKISKWSVVAKRSSALRSSVARMWVRIPAWPVAALVSLSKTLNHNCFVLRMERKAVGPVCCVMHVLKEPRTLIVKEKGLAPVFLDSHLEHPAGWICARYKSYHYHLLSDASNVKCCCVFALALALARKKTKRKTLF